MQVEQIDVVRVQPSQTGFHRREQVPAVRAPGIRITGPAQRRVFRRKDQAFAVFPGEFAKQALGAAIGVGAGGVDEIAAALDIEVEQLACLVLLGAPAPFGAEGRRAERQR
ncbi:hypothetical protein GCM10012286_23050 [Streptomyces lasiicapitis]|uniref:Uncharacterized protein n=1 Tax=Streptomyces lasiicapitis TaxID=1923961 RepID=A0ABQ2LRF6_9ACTN|nr:hypothetical protein GCM10012286_23050 [Streptomyces lasiicapitis]